MVIAKATGKNLTEYLYETLWNPMGAEQESLWQVDSVENGSEKPIAVLHPTRETLHELPNYTKITGSGMEKHY
jgi:CubicO group peptidase (beta-lactamase class C family)